MLAVVYYIFVELVLADHVDDGASYLCDLEGCIVAAGQHHAIEEILEADLDVGFQLCSCADQSTGLFGHVESYFCCYEAVVLE